MSGILVILIHSALGKKRANVLYLDRVNPQNDTENKSTFSCLLEAMLSLVPMVTEISLAREGEFPPLHYGTKPGHFETSKIHFPTNEGVSEVSERANE